jgi:hypothetical protein
MRIGKIVLEITCADCDRVSIGKISITPEEYKDFANVLRLAELAFPGEDFGGEEFYNSWQETKKQLAESAATKS